MNDLTYGEARDLARFLAARWDNQPIGSVFGVPTGGVPVALWVAALLDVPLVQQPTTHTLVVDDLVDSGRTLERYDGHHRDALIRKPHSPAHLAPYAEVMDGWVTFPWEAATAPTDSVRRLLQHIGEDPDRDGLLDTPKRVTKALTEMTEGYGQNAADHLTVTFDVNADQMIVVQGIEFVSMCEHHMLPFTGRATIGYLPNGRVVGLSKFARVVDVFARRLQVQERLTQQIADAIQDVTDPLGVGVVVSSLHSCMALRGVRKQNSPMVTSALIGKFRDDPTVRAEFLSLAHHR